MRRSRRIAYAFLWLAIASVVSNCGLRRRSVMSARVDCTRARTASVETLADLGYAVRGIYEPVPQRMTIVAAEKVTPQRTFQANITIACNADQLEVTAAQPALAIHDPHFEEDFRAGWAQRAAGQRPTALDGDHASGAAPPAGSAARPSVRCDLLSAPETRDRFGSDLTAAGLLAARLRIVNHTARTYLVSTPLLTIHTVKGEGVAPLSWSAASALIARSNVGQGGMLYEDVSRELVADQIVVANASLDGILLYPTGDYRSIHVLLIDQQSAHPESFALPLR